MAVAEGQELVGRVEALLEELETLPEGPRELATEAVGALLELYGEGLERIVSVLAERDDGSLAATLTADELVAHLLLLHGLHPVALEDRVAVALATVRPYLESHGGDVELLGIEQDTVRLRLRGSCSGCPSSTMTLKLAIENAIRREAPEVVRIDAEGAVEPAPPAPSLLQIELSPALSAPAETWTMAGGLPELGAGGVALKRISGQPLLFLRIGERLLGYRSRCPACEVSLAEASLAGAELCCPGCARRYDVLRAGRCLDAPALHLEPVPLLQGEDGLVRVALGAGA